MTTAKSRFTKSGKYFRNKTEVAGADPESLWELRQGYFVLVDDDQLTKVPASEYGEFFYPIPAP